MSNTNPRELTPEERSKGGKRGAQRRNEVLGPQKRQSIATMAVAIREAKRMGWDPYLADPSDLQFIQERIYKLQALEAMAWAEGDREGVLKCIQATFPWFSRRVAITWMQQQKGATAIEIDTTTERRLEEAAQRREKAVEGESEPSEKK